MEIVDQSTFGIQKSIRIEEKLKRYEKIEFLGEGQVS